MRTQEQIRNLRNVLAITFGPFAMFLTDEAIDKFGDRLQDRFDYDYVSLWRIRIKTQEDKDLSWEQITPEPKEQACNLLTLKKRCYSLLNKYPNILELQISDVKDNRNQPLILKQGSQK